MEIRVLGPLEVSTDAGVADLGGPRQRAVLAVLAAHHPDPVPPDQLAHAVWEGEPPPSAASTLRGYLSVLRRALAPERRDGPEAEVLPRTPGGYRLHVHAEEIDAWRFDQAVNRARELRDAHALDDAAATYRDALALWRGQPYQDFAYADFARAEVTRLEELRLTCAEELFAVELENGRHHRVVVDLEAHCARHPLREHARGLLMTALYRCGRQAEALRAYEDGRIRLRDELGVDPSPALQQRYSAILDQAEPATPAPTRSGQSRARQGNVPRRRSSFVGRRDELDEVGAALVSGRLVTLTGPGGVGKTRLALEVARRNEDRYPDGVWICELDAVDAGDAAVHTVASTLGVQRAGDESMFDRVVAVLRERHILLVLDNCEHVLDDVAELVDRALASGADIAVLATSRERLGIEGEIAFPLAPLEVRAETSAEQSDAEVLFLSRAADARPGLRVEELDRAAVISICRALDGVPLAIELAAARVAVMSPGEIATHLGEGHRLLGQDARRGPDRHRSLDAAVGWSYANLSSSERQVFERLAVFSGGFEIDAAADVVADLDVDVVESLGSLVAKSMVTVSFDVPRTRYSMLETLRHFALARLGERGAAASTYAAHADHFLELTEQLMPSDLVGVLEPMDACTRDMPNIRAAVHWSVSIGDVDRAVRMVGNLWLLSLRGVDLEPVARAVAAMPDASAHDGWPGVLTVLTHCAWMRGDLDGAEAMASEALASIPDDGDRRRVLPLFELGIVSLFQGRLHQAIEISEVAAQIALRHDARVEASACLGSAVLGHLYSGDAETALQIIDARSGDLDGCDEFIAVVKDYEHAEVLSHIDPDRALSLLEGLLERSQAANLPFNYGISLTTAASLHARQGNTSRSLELFAELVEHHRLNAMWIQQWTGIRNLVELFGSIGAEADALVLLAAAEASEAAPPTFGEQGARLAALSADLEDRLGPEEARMAADQGRQLSDQEAVRYALGAIERALSAVG